MNACGCGEEQIPWMLARFGLLGAAGVVLGLLVVMILAGWLLVGVVSAAGRRRRPREAPDDAPPGSLDGFTWRPDDS